MSSERRTVMVHAGALGDLISILPALELWRVAAGGLLTAIVRSSHGELLTGLGIATGHLNIDGPGGSSLFRSNLPATPVTGLEALIGGAGHAIVFCAAGSPVPGNLRRLGIPTVLHHPPFPPLPMSITDYHLRWLAGLCGAPARLRWPLIPVVPVEPAADCGGNTSWETRVVLAPGSGGKAKNWPLSRFITLRRYLGYHAPELLVTWLVGPAEVPLELQLPAADSVVRQPLLSRLAAGLSRAQILVGNDSGTSHLAAAVGCPTVALFGPSDQRVWAPRGPRVLVVAAQTMRQISVSRVLAAVLRLRPRSQSSSSRADTAQQ